MRAAAEESSDRPRRRRALLVTWFTYASYYLGRKGFSVAKVAVGEAFGLGTGALAAIDTGFLVAYAVGQLPSGLAADRFGPRRVLTIGLAVSALACAALSEARGAAALLALFAVNGFAQATGWPATTKAVAEWTRPSERGRVMGVWSTCYQVGGVAATAAATYLLAHFGWRSVFLGPAVWLGLVAAVVAAFLERGPEHASGAAALTAPPQARPWSSPLLWSYGAAYFCLKLIRYSLMFWLPFYLHNAAGFDPVQSGYMSTAFEFGGAIGSVGLGVLSDRSGGRRAPSALASLALLSALLFCYARLGAASQMTHIASLFCAGMLLYGPDALLSGAAAQDVGGAASGSAVGFVNALGSAGALLQGALIAFVQTRYGWPALFQVLLGLAVASCVCLLPALRRPREH